MFPFSWARPVLSAMCVTPSYQPMTEAHTCTAAQLATVPLRSLLFWWVTLRINNHNAPAEKEEKRHAGGGGLIGSDDVIFKLHAFHISWFSFKSVKVETPQKKKKKEKKKKSLSNVHCSHIWAQQSQVTSVIPSLWRHRWSSVAAPRRDTLPGGWMRCSWGVLSKA